MVECRAQNIAGAEVTEPFVIDTALVQDVVADGTAQQEAQAPLFVAEGILQRQQYVGICVADNLVVRFGNALYTCLLYTCDAADE